MNDALAIPVDALLTGDCAVELVGPSDDTLAHIEVIPAPTDRTLAFTGLDSVVGPIVERLPDLVRDGRRLFESDTVFRVVLTPDLLLGTRDGSLTFARSRAAEGGLRLNLVVNRPGPWGDRRGAIVGQGSVVPLPPSRAGDLLSAGFRVATFAMGQVHLDRITGELKAIRKVVGQILGHLEADQGGKLRSWAKRLVELGRVVRRGRLSTEDTRDLRVELDRIAVEADGVAEALQIRLRVLEHEVESTRASSVLWDSFDGGAGKLNRVDEVGARLAALHRWYQQALWVRLVASELRAIVGDSPEAVRRIKEVGRLAKAARKSLNEALPFASQDYSPQRAILGFYIPDPVGVQIDVGGAYDFESDLGPDLSSADGGWRDLEGLARVGKRQANRLAARFENGVELEVLYDSANRRVGAWKISQD